MGVRLTDTYKASENPIGLNLPISALIPTKNRSNVLLRTLQSLASQSMQPVEIIIVDASDNNFTKQLLATSIKNLNSQIIYQKATIAGAAAQRNQAFGLASQPYILFMDDDILLEEDCIKKLWDAIEADSTIGGVNAMITNQRYQKPGRVSEMLLRVLHGKKEESYAGMCIGPALNLLPEDNDALPEIVKVEWLNIGCTLYRKEALPTPMFSDNFYGYSLMEDVTLSLTVGKNWKLYNARTARIFHDSQPGSHKQNVALLAKMELVNRHFVMTKILGRNSFKDYIKLIILQLFGLATALASFKSIIIFPKLLLGKFLGILSILKISK